jgi:C4-dicarboxylate-specific signal transduction histidine kinase
MSDTLVILLVSLVTGGLGLLLGLMVGRRTASAPRGSPVAEPEPPVVVARNEALPALAAGIVHEVAQPLSAARVSIEGLHYLRQLGRQPTPEQVARTLDRVGMSLVAMTQVLDHLRFLAGVGSRALLPVRIEEVVANLIADRANWLRFSDVEMRLELAGPMPALADPSGLRLVLANLARNAAEAVNDLPPERRWVRFVVGPACTLTVEDPGPGIPASLASRLFEPFISSRGEARGVGLSLAKAAVERMDGSLAFAPRLGGGTIFTVHLKSAEAKP